MSFVGTPVEMSVGGPTVNAYLDSIRTGKTPLTLGNSSVLFPIRRHWVQKLRVSSAVHVDNGDRENPVQLFVGPDEQCAKIVDLIDEVVEALAKNDEPMLKSAQASIRRVVRGELPATSVYDAKMKQFAERMSATHDSTKMLAIMAEMNAFIQANKE